MITSQTLTFDLKQTVQCFDCVKTFWLRFHSPLNNVLLSRLAVKGENIYKKNACFIFIGKCKIMQPGLCFLDFTSWHVSTRSSSPLTWSTRPDWGVASPTSRTRKTQTCAGTSCAATSLQTASPAWPQRYVWVWLWPEVLNLSYTAGCFCLQSVFVLITCLAGDGKRRA